MNLDKGLLRGEVWWVALDPSVGGGIGKNLACRDRWQQRGEWGAEPGSGGALTSNVDRLYPAEAYVTLNEEQRKAMAERHDVGPDV